MNLSRNGKATTQACAACKYQRKKCVPDCILAPYFPQDRQRQFLSVHKLFGVSNITKMIKHLDPLQKDEAMRSIIFQSHARATDPVGGCYRIIHDLQTQIEYSRAELHLVLQQLAIFRPQPPAPHLSQPMYNDVNAALVNGGAHYVPQPQQEQYGWVQHRNSNSNDNTQSQVEDLNKMLLPGNSTVGGSYEDRALLSMSSSMIECLRFDITEDFEMWSDEEVLLKMEDGVLTFAGEDPSHQHLKGTAKL